MPKKIYLIDGNSFIYRMFFALPEFSTKDGRIVNATFGMAKFLTQQLVKELPDYVIFIKDAKGENFRHKLYSEYKATRERMPDSLRSQISDIEELVIRIGMQIIEISGYEADDVIGTLAERLAQKDSHEIYILSGDKDLYALVNEQVKVYDIQRKKISGPGETFEKFGVNAGCVRDYLAICGDTSDNIPGISGIGPKKAQVLLNYFGSLEAIYENIEALNTKYDSFPEEVQKLLKGKSLEKFIEGKELAFLSQKLATLDCDVELEGFDLEDFSFHPKEIFTSELRDFFIDLEFHSLLSEKVVDLKTWESLGIKVNIIGDSQGLKELQNIIHQNKELTLDTETTSLNVFEAELVGVSIGVSGKVYYINLLHSGPRVSTGEMKDFLTNILSLDIMIIGHNLKYDLQIIELFLKQDKDLKPQKQQNIHSEQMGLGI